MAIIILVLLVDSSYNLIHEGNLALITCKRAQTVKKWRLCYGNTLPVKEQAEKHTTILRFSQDKKGRNVRYEAFETMFSGPALPVPGFWRGGLQEKDARR